MNKPFFKSIAVIISSVLILSIIQPIEGAQFYFTPRNKGAEIGFRMPFGKGSQPESEYKIKKLKEEETKGAGSLIGLIILGACIITAAVLLTNESDDVTDTILDKAKELEEKYKDKIN